jgi:hypothetical protein
MRKPGAELSETRGLVFFFYQLQRGRARNPMLAERRERGKGKMRPQISIDRSPRPYQHHFMTVQDADRIAAGHVQRLRLPARLDGLRVLLTDYADEDTLRFLKTEEPEITLAGQRMLNEAFARLIQRRGGRVSLVPVNVSDYFGWLGKFSLSDSPANRAQFIAWLTAPEPRPHPI